MAKKYYIKKRDNPQLKQNYYVVLGQLTKKEADLKISNSIYGSNYLLEYNNKIDYNEAIKNFKLEGYLVH